MDKCCLYLPSACPAMEYLRTVLPQFGIPENLVSYNDACFTAEEFQAFMASNGIKHITLTLHHPTTNGLSEHPVQILKNGLKKLTEGTIIPD